MARKSLEEISREVMSYAVNNTGLPEPWCHDPDYQAALALWKCIVIPGQNKNARLTALKEYYDRVHGKAGTGLEAGEGMEEVDLGRLTPDESRELIRLLAKAKGKETA